MKIRGTLLILVFFSFILSPTVLCIVKGSSDITAFYTLVESEKNQEEELKKSETKGLNENINNLITLAPLSHKKPGFYIDFFKYDVPCRDIFIPPPNRA